MSKKGKKGKSRFSLFRVLKRIVFAPSFVFLVVYIWKSDVRIATLYTLYVVTFTTSLRLISHVFKAVFSSMTFNVFGLAKQMMEILTESVMLVLFWTAYMLIW